MANGKFSINIASFDGDPDTLPFFMDQIRSVAVLNKLSDQATVTLLKSKLTGTALKFLTQKRELLQANDIDVIEKELTNFFAPPSRTQSFVEFNKLTMISSESVKNVAHRLDVLTSKVYPDILDPISVNNIKFLKFISILPSSLRIKIQEENITDYNQAVSRAQSLQEISNGEKLLNSNSAPVTNDNIFAESLKQISEQINALQLSTSKSCNENDKNASPKHDNFASKKNKYSSKTILFRHPSRHKIF